MLGAARRNAARETETGRRKFVVVALPMVDVRSFLSLQTGKTGAIYWPDPPYGDEFVRGVGPMRPRPRRGVTPWIGEGHFVDLGRGVRYASDKKDAQSPLRPVYRRYYSDGVTGRVEVALDFVGDSHRPSDVAAEALRFPVRLAGQSQVVKLGTSGDQLALMMAQGTTRVVRVPAIMDWWLSAGSPVTVVRDTYQAMESDGEWALLQAWRSVDETQVSQWTMRPSTRRWSWQDERQLRVHLLRLHTEIEGLRTVLRLCRLDKLQLNQNFELQDYLETRTEYLLKGQFGGYEQRALLQQSLHAFGANYTDELMTIEQTYEHVGRGLARKLESLARILSTESTGAQGQQRIIILNGGTMTDNSVNISGGNVGAAQGGSGNTQTIEALNQSIAQGGDASEILAKTLDFVRGLRAEGISEDVVAEGEDLAEAAKDEAAKDQPDKSKLGRWLNRLKGWAETVGDVAAPVLTAVGAVAKIII